MKSHIATDLEKAMSPLNAHKHSSLWGGKREVRSKNADKQYSYCEGSLWLGKKSLGRAQGQDELCVVGALHIRI